MLFRSAGATVGWVQLAGPPLAVTDTRFLEQILQTGESEQVRQLAQQIVSSQQAEIAQMEALLNK